MSPSTPSRERPRRIPPDGSRTTPRTAQAAGRRPRRAYDRRPVGRRAAGRDRACASGGEGLDPRRVRHPAAAHQRVRERRAGRAGHARGRRGPHRRAACDLRRPMTELLVGTKKGLFVLEGEAGSAFEPTARAFGGEPVEFALRTPSGRVLASVTSPFYGPKVFYTDDPAGEWEQAEGVALPEGGDAVLERVWTLAAGEAEGTVYAGGDPGVLFESRDDGATFELNRALWEQ